ncbi:MAG: acylneuraminate cytidylyltransferase [Candidatus Lindowbacteria bacterium]|nr:acylneuraminate cytidylyltransferase [Candidatus Lindowbacteria bacterium]
MAVGPSDKRLVMDILCIIPARGGSKRLRGKNYRKLCEKPLIVHSIDHANESKLITETVVSTDHRTIISLSKKAGAIVVERPKRISGDGATSESAVLHALDSRKQAMGKDPDIVVFLQCTSPIRAKGEIDRAIKQFIKNKADSMFSAHVFNKLVWEEKNGKPVAINWDFKNRKREQEIATQYRENGSLYIFKPKILRKHLNRLGGKIDIFLMDESSSHQIDSLEDFRLCEWILKNNTKTNNSKKLPKQLDLLVFDFDGVFTDNKVKVMLNKVESVICDRSDSLGISQLRKKGIEMVVLSTEKHKVVSERCAKMKLKCIHGLDNKLSTLEKYAKRVSAAKKNIIYVGNDINDMACMNFVGTSVAVGDSHPAILSAANIVLTKFGGNGAVREICDLIERRYYS